VHCRRLQSLYSTSWHPSAQRALGCQLALWYGTSNRRPSCCGRSSQLRRHASSAIAMFPGLSHSSLAYYGAVAMPLQTNTLSTISAAAADWQTPTFALSRTRPSPKAAVAYVCREGADVESLARQPCEHRSIDAAVTSFIVADSLQCPKVDEFWPLVTIHVTFSFAHLPIFNLRWLVTCRLCILYICKADIAVSVMALQWK